MKANYRGGIRNDKRHGVDDNLIEQLRRNSVPGYFTDADRKSLSDRIKKTVDKALKK